MPPVRQPRTVLGLSLRRLRYSFTVLRHLWFGLPLKATYWEALGVFSQKKGISVSIEHIDRVNQSVTLSMAVIDMRSARVIDRMGSHTMSKKESKSRTICWNLDAEVTLDLTQALEAWDEEAKPCET